MLQNRSRDVLGALWPAILGFWCTNHRIDIVAARPEKEIQYVKDLLSFFRSVVGHVMFSSKAQGILEYIAKVLFDENGANVDSHARSLASLHRAPTRWLSDAVPLKNFISRIQDLILYAVELSESAKKVVKELGQS